MYYTPEDERLIEAKWQELVEACRKAKICRREDDWQFVRRAYFLAKEAHKGPKDPRNSLFMDYMRFVRDIKPKFFVMENVPGILSAKTKNFVRFVNIRHRRTKILLCG